VNRRCYSLIASYNRASCVLITARTVRHSPSSVLPGLLARRDDGTHCPVRAVVPDLTCPREARAGNIRRASVSARPKSDGGCIGIATPATRARSSSRSRPFSRHHKVGHSAVTVSDRGFGCEERTTWARRRCTETARAVTSAGWASSCATASMGRGRAGRPIGRTKTPWRVSRPTWITTQRGRWAIWPTPMSVRYSFKATATRL
jgi:hypothetical protein